MHRLHRIVAYLRHPKRLRALAIGAALAVLVVLGGIGYRSYLLSGLVPEVVGASFDLEYRRVPFNIPKIDFVFSIPMQSVASGSITVSPAIPGYPVLTSAKTVSYVLNAPLTVGDSYVFTLTGTLASAYGKPLGTAKSYEIQAVAGATATRILPVGDIDDLSPTISVLFNIPMVPFGTLAARDRLPCPLQIVPAVNGTCKWTTASVLEFVPDAPLAGATDYSLAVRDMSGLLFPLTTTLTGSLATPSLSIDSARTFSPADGIVLHANFPVSLSELSSRVTVREGDATTPVPVTVEPMLTSTGSEADTAYRVRLTGRDYLYSTAYHVTIAHGLPPEHGNRPLAADITTTYSTRDFASLRIVREEEAAQAYSSRVTETEPAYTSHVRDPIPTHAVSFFLTLDEPQDLRKDFFGVTSASGEPVPFDLAYVPAGTGSTIPDDHTRIRLTLTTDLRPDTDYSLILHHDNHPRLRENVTYVLHTAPTLRVLSLAFRNNTESCLYTNNPIDESLLDSGMTGAVVTTPASRIHGIVDTNH